MISLQKINIKFANKTFQPETKKYLKLSADNYIKKLKNPAKYINDSTLEWSQAINLPFGMNKPYSFEVLNKHQFGYNPQQLSSVYFGKIIVPENSKKTSFSWQVCNQKNEKVGFLTAEVRLKANPAKTQIPLIPIVNVPSTMESTGSLKILSIITHLPIVKGKNAMIVLKSSAQSIKTDTVKSRSGELVFIDQLELAKVSMDQAIEVELHEFKQGQETHILAKGKFIVEEDKHKMRIGLFTLENKEVGQMYIEYKFNAKPTISSSRIQSKVRYGVDSMVFKNISHISSTNISKSKNFGSAKKISVVISNNDIRFSKEKRFTDYTDKKSDYVSYLDNRNFQFREKQSNKFYRGASIGRGQKHDFTHFVKFNPGVGEYKLPSIWDRY